MRKLIYARKELQVAIVDLWYYRLGMFFQSIFDVNLKLGSTKEIGNINP